MTSKIIPNKCLVCKNAVATKNNKFCSVACYRKHQRAGAYKIPVELHTGKTKINCTKCNNEFYQNNSKIKENDNNFCSMRCYQDFHTVDRITIQCKGCGKDKILSTLDAIKKKNGQINFYCNDGCKRKKQISTCKVCGVLFSGVAFRGTHTVNTVKNTCSTKCLREFYRTDKGRKNKISIAMSGENHPNYINGSSKNGRVRKTDKRENFSNRDKRAVLELFSNQCFKCKSENNLTIDHHLPFSLGGRLTRSNTVVLCRSCNSSKNAKHPTKFYTEKELKRLDIIGINHNNLFNFIF